jgi:hypothetical protein
MNNKPEFSFVSLSIKLSSHMGGGGEAALQDIQPLNHPEDWGRDTTHSTYQYIHIIPCTSYTPSHHVTYSLSTVYVHSTL